MRIKRKIARVPGMGQRASERIHLEWLYQITLAQQRTIAHFSKRNSVLRNMLTEALDIKRLNMKENNL